MLLRVHRVLIGATIALAALFAIRAFVLFAQERAAVNLAMGVGASVVACVLVAYLRKLRAQHRERGDL